MPRALALVSGGIDSPVAIRLLQEQGMEVEAIHFSLEPFTDANPEEKSIAACAILGIPELTVIQSGPMFGDIAKLCAHRLYFVLSKRFMLRVATEIARERGIEFLVTGENLGQVSSQTLSNLTSIDACTTMPILRPLLGYDKVDIVGIAEKLGTFEVSVGPEVCDILGPDRPATRTRADECAIEDAKIGIEDVVAKAVATATRTRVQIPA